MCSKSQEVPFSNPEPRIDWQALDMSKIKGNMHDQEPRTAAGKSNRSKRPHVLDTRRVRYACTRNYFNDELWVEIVQRIIDSLKNSFITDIIQCSYSVPPISIRRRSVWVPEFPFCLDWQRCLRSSRSDKSSFYHLNIQSVLWNNAE